MHHSLPISPQFYVTAPQPCPYLADRVERKLFTALHGDNAQTLNDVLSHQGFRRSQNVLYRPSCSDCSMCLSARIRVADFTPSKSQKRVIRRNRDLRREGNAPWATEEQYTLFRQYLSARHKDGGMADMDVFEFASMIEETPVRSRIVEYSNADEDGERDLKAVCLSDVLSDGLSMVYSFFDTDLKGRSLGTYVILDHIDMARRAGLSYVYLGYWVPGSPKMDYKKKFQPLEIFADGRWQDSSSIGGAAPAHAHPLATDPISDQIAAIELPDIS